MNPPRKLHIKSYGCQMNVYDAPTHGGHAGPGRLVETTSVDDADLVILNTCHIREKGVGESLFRAGTLARRQGRGRAPGPSHEYRGRRHASRRPRAARSSAARGRGRCGRSAKLSSSSARILLARAKSHGRALETEFPVQDKFGFLPPPNPQAIRARGIHPSSRCRKVATSSAPSCVVPITRRGTRRVSSAGGENRRRCVPARRQWRCAKSR